MRVLAHRGLWRDTSHRPNSLDAISAATAQGYGVETDIRDRDGGIVVAHDPSTDASPPLRDVLAKRSAGDGPLALNVKADGLARATASLLAEYGMSDTFTFDMSIPDQLAWIRAGVPTLSRWSDVEAVPALQEAAVGLWIDALQRDLWWSVEEMRHFIDSGRIAAFVSPELHGRPHEPLWYHLAAQGWAVRDSVLLCTDLPDVAEEFFS